MQGNNILYIYIYIKVGQCHVKLSITSKKKQKKEGQSLAMSRKADTCKVRNPTKEEIVIVYMLNFIWYVSLPLSLSVSYLTTEKHSQDSKEQKNKLVVDMLSGLQAKLDLIPLTVKQITIYVKNGEKFLHQEFDPLSFFFLPIFSQELLY